jgi:hypothetical protein
MAKYSAVVQLSSDEAFTLQRILSTETAVQYCGGRPNFDELVKHHGLGPYSAKRGAVTYDTVDIDAAISRKKAADIK